MSGQLKRYLVLLALIAPLWSAPAAAARLDVLTIEHLTALPVLRGPTLDPEGLARMPVVVAFFASWCVPCRAGFVELRELIDEVGRDNIAVVAVNWLEDVGHYPGGTFRLQRLLDRVAPHISVLTGDAVTSEAFGGVTSLPTLFVFSEGGTEIFRFEYDGVSPPSHPTHEELLRALASHQ